MCVGCNAFESAVAEAGNVLGMQGTPQQLMRNDSVLSKARQIIDGWSHESTRPSDTYNQRCSQYQSVRGRVMSPSYESLTSSLVVANYSSGPSVDQSYHARAQRVLTSSQHPGGLENILATSKAEPAYASSYSAKTTGAGYNNKPGYR